MKTHLKYIKWLSAAEMHQDSKEWLSELNFVLNEHFFMLKLVKDYTLVLIQSKYFNDSVELTDAINTSMKNNKELLTKIQEHENKLDIMTDGINQPKEEAEYKNVHRILIDEIYVFLRDFKTIKNHLFDRIKSFKKHEKFERLLDKE